MLNGDMLSVAGLVTRYPQGLGPALSWGGKCYYKINCSEPYNLNSTFSGFILRDDDRVQCYSWEAPPSTALLIDMEERSESIVWWDAKLDGFYPHPFFSDNKIMAFQCVRTCPSFTEGELYEVSYPEDRLKRLKDRGLPILFPESISSLVIVPGDDRMTNFDVNYMLQYPEFFKPVYERG